MSTTRLSLLPNHHPKAFSRSPKRDFAMIAMYGLQVGLGYFLMLVAMTYQVIS